MEREFCARQIALAAGRSRKTIQRRAVAERWQYRTTTTRGGTVRLYGLYDLPIELQSALHRKAAKGVRDQLQALAVEITEIASEVGRLLRLTKGGKC